MDSDAHSDNSDALSMTSSQSEENDAQSARRSQYIALIIISLVSAVQFYSQGHFDRQAYHTSALTGHAWVIELLTGHPDRIRTELGVHLHVFEALVDALRRLGCSDSRGVGLEEQLAIFLYMTVTGLTIRHVGERFQHANATISGYGPSV
jgi:hypothetical protein